MAKKTPPLQIFKTGKHTAMSGAVLEFSDADLRATAAAYNPALHEAPLVVGHPKHDDPAYGWAESVAVDGDLLVATPHQIDPAFAEMVGNHRFKKISASFYPPDSPANPVPGVFYLRHIGFLGAMPPAIKGLKNAEFSDAEADYITLEFSDPDPETQEPDMTKEELAAKQAELDEREAALKAQDEAIKQKDAQFAEREAALKAAEAAAKTGEVQSFVESLVTAGKVLPKDQNNLVAFMAADNPGDSIDFAEDGKLVKKPGTQWLREFLTGLPTQVEFGEIDKAGANPQKPGLNDKQIAQRARAYKDRLDAAGQNISFAEAVDAVNAGLDTTGA